MFARSNRHALLPLLVLGLVFAMSATAQAQGQDRSHMGSGTAMSLQVNFGTTPHWMGVHGTRVREMRQSERPDYDVFRYGNRYYAYHENHWYSSTRGQGQYSMMEDRAVPRELSRVPRDHWRNYPSAWNTTNRDPAPRDRS